MRLRDLLLLAGTALLLYGCAGSPWQQALIKPVSNSPPAAPGPAVATAATGQAATSSTADTTTVGQHSHSAAHAPSAATASHAVTPNSKTGPAEADKNVWNVLRAGFRLDTTDHPRIQTELHWYAAHRQYLNRVFNRARPYLRYILEQVQKRHMPTEIALLPVVESAFRPFAYSHVRAAGLWQFIPSTARRFGLKQDWWYDGRRDVIQSTNAALDYLQQLHNDCNDDWLLALAAYNSGEGTVLNAIRYNERRGRPTDFWHLDLPPETRAYVPKLLALREIVDHPSKYGIHLKPINDVPYLTTVNTDGQIDLGLAAKLAGISLKKLYHLNPGFNRWATDPNGPHRLVLPIDAADRFERKLAKLPKDARVRWDRHKVGPGQTLSGIAMRYHTTIALLRKVNKLHNNVIRAGHHLLIPVASRQLDKYAFTEVERQLHAQSRRYSGHRVHYTVRQGDSLWNIARHYRVGVRQLALWNGMAPRDALHIGQKLVVWAHYPHQQVERSLSAGVVAPSAGRGAHYTVRGGDSLWTIARRYHIDVHELAAWNHISKRSPLHIGQKLVIRPVVGAPRHEHPTRIAEHNVGAPAPVARSMGRTIHYTVREGDSLWTIARRYRVDVHQLAAWNGISKRSPLHIGRKLIVARSSIGSHHHERPIRIARSNIAASAGGRGVGHKAQYTVRKGDSLWTIARRYHVDVHQLAAWNGISKQSPLHIGQELVVRPNIGSHHRERPIQIAQNNVATPVLETVRYKVHPGDSLSAISQRFRVSINELRRWNDLHKHEYLQPGQELKVFVDIARQADNS